MKNRYPNSPPDFSNFLSVRERQNDPLVLRLDNDRVLGFRMYASAVEAAPRAFLDQQVWPSFASSAHDSV